MNIIDNKSILITGGTGTFGKAFTKYILQNYKPKKVIIFSRDEYKQYEMSKDFSVDKYPLRYFIGDIRDKERLMRAFDGVDYVIHAAAMKQVPASEYNPFEAVKTNIIGAQNIVQAAIDKGVKKVIAISTDKAVNPINLYGGTKLVMEKLMVAGNSYVGSKDTRFSVVRYGNVMGSRGSVIPLFMDMTQNGINELPITVEEMTRFWISIDRGVELVITALRESVGGEIFIPRIPSMRITDLAKAINPNCTLKIIGTRPGEKFHETLISEEEGQEVLYFTSDGKGNYIILPQFRVSSDSEKKYKDYVRMPERFSYRSDTNDWWLSMEEIRKFLELK